MSTRQRKHAAIYVRTASRSQEDAGAVERQIQSGRQTSRDLGATVTLEFVDKGAPGTSLDRAGLQGLLTHIEAYPVDYVVCADLSRLARDYECFRALSTILERSGVEVVFANGAPRDFLEWPATPVLPA